MDAHCGALDSYTTVAISPRSANQFLLHPSGLIFASPRAC
jgi:hypothetical protein